MFAGTESIARRGEADTNQLLWMGLQQGSFGPDGDLYSRKGLGMTLLALPLVWGAMLWPAIGMAQAALLLSALVTAATGALVYRAAIRLGFLPAAALAGALAFGLATMAWPYSQEFFSDPICGFGLFAAFYGLLSFAQSGRKRYLLAGALGWALAYLARSINLVTLPIYLVGLWVVLDMRVRAGRPLGAGRPPIRLVLAQQWRPLVTFLIPVVAAGLLSLWWNWLRFGSIWETGYVESESFSAPWLFGLYGLLLGPARGFFWYNPILLLALPGAVWFWRHARRTLLVVAALSAIYVGMYAKWYMWHGGASWGPRFLVPLLPFVALLIVPVWQALVVERRYGWAGAAGAWLLALLSVGVQWLGMVIPFGLVQDWLETTVPPLYAPETFTQLPLSPLLLQWRFINAQTVHLHWWTGEAGWAAIDWVALLVPLAVVVVGLGAALRHTRRPAPSSAGLPTDAEAEQGPRPAAYVAAALVAALALLIWMGQAWRTTPEAEIAGRIADAERRRDDAILHLIPPQTQPFANAYHGRLATWGLPAQAPADQVAALLERLQAEGTQRLWVAPDGTPPEQSPWELALRSDHYLLSEVRPAGAEGPRLALYALAGVQPQSETGMGTLFGDPALAGQSIDENNGWFRLAGYRLTSDASPGGELLLALRWESLQPVTQDYHVFVHLLDRRGEKVAQRDGRPVQWLRPTTTWQPGESIIDRYGIPLPADLPTGPYTIVVGLYDPVTGQRLPVSAGPGDFAIELGPIQVTQR
jgi:hypothetical protein